MMILLDRMAVLVDNRCLWDIFFPMDDMAVLNTGHPTSRILASYNAQRYIVFKLAQISVVESLDLSMLAHYISSSPPIPPQSGALLPQYHILMVFMHIHARRHYSIVLFHDRHFVPIVLLFNREIRRYPLVIYL